MKKAAPLTAHNFNRAESDMYFAQTIKLAGGIGKLYHRRELEPIEKQLVIRANRDTLYSAGVFDLDAGPVMVTMPDPGKRFMSMIAIDEDQYAVGRSPTRSRNKAQDTQTRPIGVSSDADSLKTLIGSDRSESKFIGELPTRSEEETNEKQALQAMALGSFVHHWVPMAHAGCSSTKET
jgi:hypothetical protein